MTDPFEVILREPVMAILRGFGRGKAVDLAERAWDVGIRAVEVTVQTEDALPALEAVVAAGRERGLGVGAGSVISHEQLVTVARLGVAFTVAPGFAPELASRSWEMGIAHLPGVATATEIRSAVVAGHRWVKAFPAVSLGTAWFRSMLGPFPQIRLVGTGGIHAGNAETFLEAGAAAVAVGSALQDPAQLESLAELLGQP